MEDAISVPVGDLPEVDMPEVYQPANETLRAAAATLDQARRRRRLPVAELARRTPSTYKPGVRMKWPTVAAALKGQQDSVQVLAALADTLGMEMKIVFMQKAAARRGTR